MADEIELLESINRRLGVLVALGVRGQMEDATQKQVIESLAALGLDAGEVSDLLRIPRSTVAPIVSRMKATGKG